MNTRLFAFVFAILISLCVFVARPIFSQDEDDAEAEARKTAERFLLVLERNPRRGTALDKVVEFHVDHESLDELIARLQEQAEATEFEDAGRAWLVVGLIEASQGDAESAQLALERAEELLPKSAVASFSLGQNLMTLNRWEDAAAALERAIQRKPAPTDFLDLFQTLGRVRQRLVPGDKVVEVWTRLEKLVPNDPRVPELVAKTLLDDGHWEAALPRFEALARATKDLYQRSEFELEAVDLRLKLGQFEQALAEADRLLGGLKQDHWLFRETRRRIEEAFLAKDDAAGLIKHYEERLVKQPEDLDAVVRLSRTLVSQDRRKDARTRLEAGIKLAPTSVDLRMELIELLQSDQQFSEAIAQYEQLDRIEPNNPDQIRDWGFLILKEGAGGARGLRASETENKEDEQKHASRVRHAAAVWRKLVDTKPKDAVVAAQVAGLMASADKLLLGDAEELLRAAIELEPETFSHREQLGEVLDTAGKKVESLAAWRSMAEEPRRNANNLAQLAEVLSRFGYRDETLTTIDAACELDRKSLELRFQQAELRRKWKQFESAMSALAEAAARADTPETFDRVVQVEVKVLSESELLTGRIEELQAELAKTSSTSPLPLGEGGRRPGEGPSGQTTPDRGTAKPNKTPGDKTDKNVKRSETLTPTLSQSEREFSAQAPAGQHFRLAKYLEAADKLREATVAARKAVELAPRNGVFIQAAARMLTLDSQWLSAVELYERLLKIDRRFRIDSLRSIVELEQKLGRKEKALKAGRELLAAAPGNPESAEFVVDVCLRFGQNAEALQILRRASRQNVADKRLALRLVERLMEDGPRQLSGTALAAGQVGGNRLDLPAASAVPLNATNEAREILWRVFEQTAKSDDRIEVVRKLAELSVFPGEFTKLVQRLERYRAEPKLRRDASLALVQVHEQAGDTQQARRELERWLPQAPRDPVLLARMVSLCETAGDLDGAIAHQQRLAELTRRRETDEHLIVLLRRAGRDTDADSLATRWLETERDPAKVLKEIDRLLSLGNDRRTQNISQALKLAQAWLDRDPQHWEFLIRSANALLLVGQEKEAHATFDEIMALPLPDDTLSLLAARGSHGAKPADHIAARVHQVRQRMQVVGIPTDFGAARVSILIRLMGQQPVVQTTAEGDNPTLARTRTAWDAMYREYFNGSRESRLKSAMNLIDVAPDDAGVQWLLLQSIAVVREYANNKPLEALGDIPINDTFDDRVIAKAVAAFRRLQSCDEALEWDTFPVADIVCRELFRSQKIDDLDRLLTELETTTESPACLSWLLRIAANRSDKPMAFRVLSKYVEIIPKYQHASATTGKGTALADPSMLAFGLETLLNFHFATGTNVPDNRFEKAFEVLDAAFAAFADPRMPRAAMHPKIVVRTTTDLQVNGQQSKFYRPEVLDYSLSQFFRFAMPKVSPPDFPPDDVLADIGAIRVLHHLRQRAGNRVQKQALLTHVKAAAQRAEPNSRERFLWMTGLACLHWWEPTTSEAPNLVLEHQALAPMRELFELPQAMPSLKLGIVSCHLKLEKFDEALNLLDRITTTDGQILKEIEQRAVQLAGKLGRVERVRVAAERLFGMRLEPQEELQLAATLSGLGLHEQAEAIRQRLPQRAGNNLAVLQQAMQERIDAKQLDEACQIAEQIVRRTSPANTLIGSAQQATFGGGQQARVITTTSVARTKALALLGQQGRLGPLIEQAEQQFDRSPNSLKLFGQLAELYGAESVGQASSLSKSDGPKAESQAGSLTHEMGQQKIAKLLVRLADSDAPDPQFRLTLARALVSAGKAELAVPHFLFAIERLPNATAQVLFEAEQILSELGHVDELAAIVLKSKLAVNDQQRVELFRRIVQRLEGPPIRAKLIIQLFDKAFREAPDFRPILAAQLLAVSESVWQQEEMWPIARDLAVPDETRKSPGPWYGIDVSRRHSGKQIDSMTRRIVELAAQLKRLDELAAIVETARQAHPDWTLGGNVTLGMIRLKQGKLDEAKKLFAVLMPKTNNVTILFGPQVSEYQGFILLVCGIGVELARAHDFEAAASFYELSSDTETVLEHCRWFGKEPAMQQLAVRIVNRMLAGLDDPAELTRQASSPLFVEAAKVTAEINQPYVAARLAQAMITRWQLPSANNSDGGTWLEQLEHRFANARTAIKPEMLPGIVGQVFNLPGPSSSATSPSTDQANTTGRAGWKPAPRVDLLPHVTGDSLANLRLDSPFVPLLKEAAKDNDLWAKWRMGTLFRPSDDAPTNAGTGKSAHPPNLSLAILASLTELFALDSPSDLTALSQLVETAKSHLKTERSRTAPAGFHQQLGLWLVARECLAREEYQKVGHELADLATESASLHFDPRFQWAILRERGELALKASDKELARTLWARLAEDVLRPRSAEEAVPMLLGKQFVWSANWANTRLNRARDLCRLTLNAEMPDLSLAIFRDAINGSKKTSSRTQTQTESLDGEFLSVVNLSEDILATWDTLESEWRASGVSADEIFATLLECVLPTNRSDKVFVFAAERPDVGVRSTEVRPQSLALRLVEQAIAEKRNDQLAQRLAEREKTVKHKLPLRLIQLLLALQTNNEQRLDAELVHLEDFDWSQPVFQSSCIAKHIVSLLAPLTQRHVQVAKLFDNLISPLSKAYSRNEHPLADVRRWIAKQQLADGQIDKAKETVSAHLRHMDQVWSATGAMDGQHLRRLELLAIATDYASAGLTHEAIALLAQVADARWPDRYADENPGPVLAILEAKLKSRPAQERYELWRAWSLPNDGVKSMRMLTGSEVKGQNPEVRKLKSTAHLLVEAAREADRLAELDAFVEEQMKQRPSDRIHVLLALIHFANKVPAVAETLVRQQITLWESQAGKNNSATRTRIWDDWLLSVACSRHESLRELAEQLAKRTESGARELKDEVLLNLLRR